MAVTVIGAGSWGTALSILIAKNADEVILLGRPSERLDEIQRSRENARYLSGVKLPTNVTVRALDAASVADDCVLAVPSDAITAVLPQLGGSKRLLIATKGLEPSAGQVVSTFLKPELTSTEICAMGGPNLAIEVAKGVPTVTLVAGEAAERWRDLLQSETLRVYLSDDLVGVQLAGALKNIYAIGAGMSDGLGFGDNTKGAYLARALNEMARYGDAHGARMETFFGVAGVGDLIATASSPLSRNYRVGRAIGEGRDLQGALQSIGQVAEGVSTCSTVVRQAAAERLHMPIAGAIDAVLKRTIQPKQAVAMLMETAPVYDGFEFPTSAMGR